MQDTPDSDDDEFGLVGKFGADDKSSVDDDKLRADDDKVGATPVISACCRGESLVEDDIFSLTI